MTATAVEQLARHAGINRALGNIGGRAHREGST